MERVMLKKGSSFWHWDICLKGELVDQNLLNIVFHDLPGIPARERPSKPTGTVSAEAQKKWHEEDERWIRDDRIAANIVRMRVHHSLKYPEDMAIYDSGSAIYDHVLQIFRESAPYKYTKALQRLITTKFTSDAYDYICAFNRNLGALNEAAWLMREEKDKPDPYKMPQGQAAVLFMNGTNGIQWLREWRACKAMQDEGGFAPLTSMMRSLREYAADRKRSLELSCVGNGRDDLCNRKGCRRFRNHTNEECFKR